MLQPRPSDYISLPTGGVPRFVVVVDTEEEFDWSAPLRRSNTSVNAIRALPDGHRLLTDLGVSPCYVVDYPVATSPLSVSILREMLAGQQCSIGTQLHAWVCPPFEEELVGRNSFAGNLPVALERAKIITMTNAIQDNFGFRPTIYKAGRYGVGRNTPNLLWDLDYRIDTSVRTLFDYSDRDGGPNFRTIDPRPYWFGPANDLLELPLTSVFTGPLRDFGRHLFAFGRDAPGQRNLRNALLNRLMLLNRVALTPEGVPLREALSALRVLKDAGTQLYVIAFHSPSLQPGHTPYVRDARDLERLTTWLREVIGFLRTEAGAQPSTLYEILELAERSRAPRPARALALAS